MAPSSACGKTRTSSRWWRDGPGRQELIRFSSLADLDEEALLRVLEHALRRSGAFGV
jgi:hypothetical protein